CGDWVVKARVKVTPESEIFSSCTSPSATMSCCCSGSRTPRRASRTAFSSTIRIDYSTGPPDTLIYAQNIAIRALTCYKKTVIAADEFRRALGHFATGVTTVTTLDADGRPTGLTASAFTTVALDPPLILVCVDHKSQSYPPLLERRRFGVNVLGLEQAAHAGTGHAVLTSSATAGLWLIFRALDVKPGAEILVPAHTAFPTVEAICAAEGTPVFVDVDDWYTLDVKDAASKVTPRTVG